MHENEEATLATLSSHRAIIDSTIKAGRGSITGTAGDSVLAKFGSIIDAVHCAVAVQQELARANLTLTAERRMQLRIGINVGDVLVQDGDLFGDGVNVAARLEGLAEPSGICVTRAVRDQVRDRLEYQFDDMGEQRVKNIARPLRVFRLVFDPHAEPVSPYTGDASSPTLADLSPTPDDIEIRFWQSVEAGGTSSEYRAYLERYPDGSFAALAKARLALHSRRFRSEYRASILGVGEG